MDQRSILAERHKLTLICIQAKRNLYHDEKEKKKTNSNKYNSSVQEDAVDTSALGFETGLMQIL